MIDNEFVGKVCVSLDRLNHFARITKRKVLKQEKLNTAIVVYAVAVTASILVLDKAVRECKSRIAALENPAEKEQVTIEEG